MSKDSRNLHLNLVLSEEARQKLDTDPLEKTPNVLEVFVTYNDGTGNWFTGASERQGFYFSTTPMTAKLVDGRMRDYSFSMGQGLKIFIEPAKRRNAKRLDALLETLRAQLEQQEGPGWEVVQATLKRYGLQLADTTVHRYRD
jgi:hypothetical protein